MDKYGFIHKADIKPEKPADKFKIPDTGENNYKVNRKITGDRNVNKANRFGAEPGENTEVHEGDGQDNKTIGIVSSIEEHKNNREHKDTHKSRQGFLGHRHESRRSDKLFI